MTLTLDEAWLAIIAALIPFLTSAVTKFQASNGLRALVAVVLSAVVAALDAVVRGEADVAVLAGAFVTALVIAFTSYVAAAKHLNTNERLLPSFGVGTGQNPPEDST